MKAKIDGIEYIKEYETKFGILHLFKISYNGKASYYSSKKKEQTFFKLNEECEFTEETQTGNNGTYTKIKPLRGDNNFSNYSRAVKKEQSKYSGFVVSYVKDLIIAGKVEIKDWEAASEKIFKFMVNLDKSIES